MQTGLVYIGIGTCLTSGVSWRRSFWSRHAGHGCGIAPHALVAPVALVRMGTETKLKLNFIFKGFLSNLDRKRLIFSKFTRLH